MAKNPYQKSKILHIAKLLLQKTDENNCVTVPQIIEYLAKQGISAERKSIYDDLKTLEDFGLDICKRKSKQVEYYIASRDFELAELKLLVDSIQSSKFITVKKSNELIQKIERLASEGEGKQLHREVYVANRVKTHNEKIYYNTDALHSAILSKKQITFKYFEWCVNFGNVDKVTKRQRKNKLYKVSPWKLTWDDENYYLIAYDNEDKKIKHYRVDKMESIEVCDEKCAFDNAFDKYNMGIYSRSVFGMFGGELVMVKIRFHNSLVGVVVDRFGKNVFISRDDDDHFCVSANVCLSPTFFGWLFGFGSKAKLLSPDTAVSQFKDYLDKVISNY